MHVIIAKLVSDWEQSMLYTKSRQLFFCVEKGYLYKQALKCNLRHEMYFTYQNIMQKRDPMKLNFKGPEMQKINITMDRIQRGDEKMG